MAVYSVEPLGGAAADPDRVPAAEAS